MITSPLHHRCYRTHCSVSAVTDDHQTRLAWQLGHDAHPLLQHNMRQIVQPPLYSSYSHHPSSLSLSLSLSLSCYYSHTGEREAIVHQSPHLHEPVLSSPQLKSSAPGTSQDTATEGGGVEAAWWPPGRQSHCVLLHDMADLLQRKEGQVVEHGPHVTVAHLQQ